MRGVRVSAYIGESNHGQSLQVLYGQRIHARQNDNAPRSFYHSFNIFSRQSVFFRMGKANGRYNHGVDDDQKRRELVWIAHASPEPGFVQDRKPWLDGGEVDIHDFLEQLWWRKACGGRGIHDVFQWELELDVRVAAAVQSPPLPRLGSERWDLRGAVLLPGYRAIWRLCVDRLGRSSVHLRRCHWKAIRDLFKAVVMFAQLETKS